MRGRVADSEQPLELEAGQVLRQTGNNHSSQLADSTCRLYSEGVQTSHPIDRGDSL